MSKPPEAICSELIRSGVSCDGLYELAAAYRLTAKSGGPVLPWLGLDGFFRGLATSIDDRPVATVDIDRLSTRLRPLFETLSKPVGDPGIIEKELLKLRDLL